MDKLPVCRIGHAFLATGLRVLAGLAVFVMAGCSPAATPTMAPTQVALVNTATPSPTTQPAPTTTPTLTARPTGTPAPTATATVIPPTPEPLYYTVESGDYIEDIAAVFGVELDALLQANGLEKETVLSVGQVLLIPTPVPEPALEPTVEPTSEASAIPEPTPAPEPLYYTVKSGDYIESIAERFGVALEDLLAANSLKRNDVLDVDQVLVIPTEEPAPVEAETPASQATAEPTTEYVFVTITHVVSKGETIESIAEDYGKTWEEIADANGISKNSVLSIGQELNIPNIAVEATKEPTAAPTGTPEAASETDEAQATATAVEATPTPGKVIYTVTEGDYLELIAASFGISAEELASANGISIDSVLSVGQELEIPNVQPTALPSSTPTITPTPTLPRRASPTPRPNAGKPAKYSYLRPVLLAPANKYVYEGAEAAVLLNWNSVGILTKKQWYQVRIWFSTVQEEPDVFYSKSTSWRPQVGFYKSESAPYTIRWQVQVVELLNQGDFTIVSPSSASYLFYWR